MRRIRILKMCLSHASALMPECGNGDSFTTNNLLDLATVIEESETVT